MPTSSPWSRPPSGRSRQHCGTRPTSSPSRAMSPQWPALRNARTNRSTPLWRPSGSSVRAVPNRLAQETSPYLRQHQDNPVDWYPWGDEAFAVARERGIPIFLSVGYSSCHWCHVMAHESFENDATAQLMNERFVNVKV